ncbi:MAG: hypothetical protein ABIJ08_06320 [Nanoarchaeota archaeon]
MKPKKLWSILNFRLGMIFSIIGCLLFFISEIKCLYVERIDYVRPVYCNVLDKMTIRLHSSFNPDMASLFFNYYAPFLSFLLTTGIYLSIGILIGLLINKLKSKK